MSFKKNSRRFRHYAPGPRLTFESLEARCLLSATPVQLLQDIMKDATPLVSDQADIVQVSGTRFVPGQSSTFGRELSAAVAQPNAAATAFLPAGKTVAELAAELGPASGSRAALGTLNAFGLNSLTSVSETERNDTLATADFVPLGFDAGEDTRVRVNGSLRIPPRLVSTAEENGAIQFATQTNLAPGQIVQVNSGIGDGSFGTTSGDFDYFVIPNVPAGSTIYAETFAGRGGSALDTLLIVYDANGNFVFANNDIPSQTQTGDSLVEFQPLFAGNYFVAVGAWNPVGILPFNPFNPASGPGATTTGSYSLFLGVNPVDQDFYRVSLNAGDVFGAATTGAQGLALTDGAGNLWVGSATDISPNFPGASPIPSGNASLAFVAPAAGNYFVQVVGGNANYTVDFTVDRPFLESQTIGTRQILFLDFNGATINPSIFGGPNATRTLSPLSSFLSRWSLPASAESSVIDSIIASVTESLVTDFRQSRLNGDFLTTGNPGDFAIDIRNSRDHADPFGQPNVSRLIIGGTTAELGIDTIGIAESLDPGNFDTTETAVILLDLLSGPATSSNSLNRFVGPQTNRIRLVGTGVGNVAVHEAGHYFGNFHTDNSNSQPGIMDQGGNLPFTVGVGADGIFGTADDFDVDFTGDAYTPNEPLRGFEDTFAVTAFALSTGKINPPRPSLAIAVTSATKAEGNSGTTGFTFTVTRSGLLTGTTTVNYAVTGNGPAPALASDFVNGVFPTGQVTFAAGQATRVITIPVRGDVTAEANEGFRVTLSGASAGATITTALATGVISNDDTSLAIAATSANKPEGNTGTTAFTFTVTRSGVLTGATTVNYAVLGTGASPATASDFRGSAFPTGQVTFAAGQTSRVITIPVRGDAVAEANESFRVTLSGASAGATVTTAVASGLIRNDDTSLAIAATSANKPEGNSGTTAFTFTVTRSGILTGVTTVNYAVTGNSANPATANDFIGNAFPGGQVTFAAGETSKVITVRVRGDVSAELDERFIVTLSNPSSGVTISTAVAAGLIRNDDL